MNASEGPSPRAMAASTSREVVTWMSSETLWVWSHWPPGRCSTKPRSVCTGPPRSTGCSAMPGSVGSSFICDSTSDSFIGRGLLRTMPSAPLSVCSQMIATVCAKLGSARVGMAIRRWLVRLPLSPSPNAGPPPVSSPGGSPPATPCLPPMPSVWACRPGVSRNRLHRSAAHAAADELPFVGKAQHAVLARQLRRKRIEGTRQLQDRERRLVEFGVAARAADDGLVERAVGADADLDHRRQVSAGDLGGGRIVERADAFDLAAPGIEVGCER